MGKIVIQKLDEVKIRVLCDSATLRSDIKESFSYFVPNYRHMPKFKWGIWDGRLSLYDARNQTMYLGLFKKVKEFAESRECEFIYDPTEFQDSDLDTSKFLSEFKSDYVLRDYQEKILPIIEKNKKGLFLSATGSGKSLMIYSVIRTVNKPTLLVVPSVSLVGQMYKDFKKYGAADPNFNVENFVQQITAGKPKEVSKPVVISTWQSIYKLPPEYFQQFQLVIADEAHKDKANKLRELIEKCSKSEYRYGFTGTLDETMVNVMILRGLFSDTYTLSTTAELMEIGHLAEMNLTQIILRYPTEVRKKRARKVYLEEIDFMLNSEARRNFITKLALRCPGNSLILFQFVEDHGQKIYEHLKEEAERRGLVRHIFFIHGKVKAKDRLEIQDFAEKNDGVIIVASLGTFAEGVNIENLENLIFAFGLKAKITTLQGMGRGLRKGRTGKVNVFDLCDDLTWKSWVNYSMRHGLERLTIYQKEKFDYKMVKVNL